MEKAIDMPRRAFLGGTGLLALSALAGCAGGSTNESSTGNAATSSATSTSSASALTTNSDAATPKYIILDLDTGIDDALALAYALGSPEVELLGVTTTFGNVEIGKSVRNVLAVLDLLGHLEIPVFVGESCGIAVETYQPGEISVFIHGDNGIGEAEIPDSTRTASDQGAVDFLIESVHTYGKDLCYIPTGPLTNLAVAINKDSSIVDEIGNVVMMGGALTVSGNVSQAAEANVYHDPEAADLVFKSGIPLTMVGLDVTLKTLLTKKETVQWQDLGTEAGAFLAEMTNYYIKAYETTSPELGGCGLHDPLAVGVALDPSLVSTFGINLTCDTEGELRGRTIGDTSHLNDATKNVQVCLDVDVERFLSMFMERTIAVAK